MNLRLLQISIKITFLLFLFTACGNIQIKQIETNYGEGKPAAKKILVAYATRAGSTSEVADAIAKALAEGAQVEIKPVTNVKDVNGYQAVVLGSAVIKGYVLPEALEFVKRYKTELKSIPVAYFIVCMTLKENTEEKRKKANAYLDPLRKEVDPIDIGLFAGKLDYSKLGSIDYIIVKYFIGEPEGDYRDWNAIKDWAAQLKKKLFK